MSKQYIPGINVFDEIEPDAVVAHLEMLYEIGWRAFFTLWNPDYTHEWKAAADRLGMIYQSIHAPFKKAAKMWQEGEEGVAAAEELIACVHDCAENHIPVMVLHPFIGFYETNLPTPVGIENFGRVVKAAEECGVRLGFENLEGEEYLAALMKEFWSSPACGFCLDTGHEQCYNGGKDLLALYGEKLCHTHFNDNFGAPDPSLTWKNDLHLPMGDGIVDWSRVMDRIDATPYEGVLMCELTLQNMPDRHTHDAYAAMPAKEFYTLVFERMQGVLNRNLKV